ncbi:putative cytochrome P450 [Macrophomina phaseolina]|uniref:Cytochrome P450 n=1 Tax=Macrophomina phaseolina TaxID=35725 RepID=A0ABQ8GD16_9PEZI|nr:putative cytochrome P450 [Macrophomina phaseolina]
MMDSSWLAPLVAGAAAHTLVRRVEIDMFLLHILGVVGALAAAHLYVSVQVFGIALSHALWSLSSGSALFVTGLTTSILVYRGFFHRLRKFPGPVAARFTKFYAVWLSAKEVRWHLELERLKAEYGDVVRTGPRELTIFRPEAIGPMAACRKSTLYQLSDWSNDRLGLIETRDIEDHRLRRKPWEMALSNKAIGAYDGRMQETISTFLSILSQSSDKPINVTELMAYLSYDLMGVVGFGKDFGQLAGGGVEHWAVKALRAQQLFFGLLKPIPWLVNAAARIPGADRAVAPFVEYCRGLVAEKRKTLQAEKSDTSSPTDILSWILHEYEAGTPHAPRTQAALDEDGRTIVVAGADTTSNTLSNVFYYLAHHPDTYARLQTQLATLFPGGATTFTYARLSAHHAATAPLLDAIIHETTRLKPAVPSGTPRVTPPSGLRIRLSGADDDLFVPPDTDVYVPPYVIQRDARYFPNPTDFIPERWLPVEQGGRPELVADRNAMFPFQVGQYACAGKGLAMWEMRSVLARVALAYDVSFAEGDAVKGKDFDEGMKDTFTMTLGPLWLVFRERGKRE